MNRTEAARAGLTRYDSGKPCRAGHYSPRYTSTGNCVACLAASRKSLVQLRNATAQGWPRVETNVPKQHLPLLRTVVDLLRRHGERGEEMRAMLGAAVANIVEHDNTPLSECLIVTGGFEAPPVAPVVAEPVEDDGMPAWHGDSVRNAADMIPAAFRGTR
jgi:hypothetical protein